LEGAAEAAMHAFGRREMAHLLALEADGTGILPQLAEELRDERRLAGAVGTDEGMELARHHVEIDAVRGEQAAEALGEAADAEEGLGRHPAHGLPPSRTSSACNPPRVDSTTASSSGPRIICQCSVQAASTVSRMT